MPQSRKTRTSLYRAFAADGSLLYVGISLHAMQRLYSHARRSTWWPEVTNVTVERFPTRRAAQKAELAAIRRERPRYNIDGSDNTDTVSNIVRELRKIARRRRGTTAAFAKAQRARDDLIREAHAAGVTPTQISEWTGLSIPRIHQIRHGGRPTAP